MKTSFGVYVLFFDISAAERIKLFSTTRLHIKEKIKIKLLFFFFGVRYSVRKRSF